MTRCTTPPTEAIPPAPLLGSETETAVRDFVRDAVSRQLEILKSSAEQFEDRSWWERGSDGYLRERRVRERWFRVDSLESFPDYQRCIKLLKSETIVAKHLDRLVGTSLGSSRFEAEQMLRRLIYAMRDDAGQLVFTEERFHEEWRGLVEFLVSDAIPRKMVAPLPYLSAPFPLELNDELVLDRLNDDEVNRCFQLASLDRSLDFRL